MKRSLSSIVGLLAVSWVSMFAAQNTPPPTNPAAGAGDPAAQGGGRQGGGRQGGGRGGGAQEALPELPPVPLVGLSTVTFKTADLAKSRQYYNGVLGLAEAFDIRNASGKVTSVYFKVNDDHYVEVTPNLQPGDIMRIGRLVFESSDLEKLHAIYVERGLNPGPITKGGDGNPVFRVVGPSNAQLDFIQIMPDSKQALARGKFLDPRRLSTKIGHVGIYTQDRAVAGPFYHKLGLTGGRVPGRGEAIDTPSGDRNIETKYPPLVDTPETHERFVRETMGATQHLGLDTDDMRATRDLAKSRGLTDLQVRVQLGNNRRWLMHLFDPDGSRTEFTESRVQSELPAWTIMAPGPVAPNILPTTPGQPAWPASPDDLKPR
jgi:catechol 2,3-dioxygenase-like lactoylglutathione lyase family enzyme